MVSAGAGCSDDGSACCDAVRAAEPIVVCLRPQGPVQSGKFRTEIYAELGKRPHADRSFWLSRTLQVANYELSDYLIQHGGRAAGITFVRYNQWPERGEAEHEVSRLCALSQCAVSA